MAPASPASRIKLLVLDVDGTVTNSRHEVTDATCRAIARVQAAGVRVMLATGRFLGAVLLLFAFLASTPSKVRLISSSTETPQAGPAGAYASPGDRRASRQGRPQ